MATLDTTTENLKRALNFYNQSPDGQYDKEVAACIADVLRGREMAKTNSEREKTMVEKHGVPKHVAQKHVTQTQRLEALAKLLDSVKGNGVEQTNLRRTQDCPGMQETQLNIQKAIAEQLAKTEAI